MDSVVYTIGFTMSYDTGLAEQGERFRKVGKNDAGKFDYAPKGYEGGIIFENPADALRYIELRRLRGYSIYEVIADWDSDCEINENDGEQAFWKHLMKTSQILRKIDPEHQQASLNAKNPI